MMINRRFQFRKTLVSLLILGFLVNTSVLAADKFRVSAQVFHLGEVIAQPVLDAVANETLGGDFYTPDKTRYRSVVLVRPMNEEKASVSLQFSSGKINIQPNLLVDIGQESATTHKKVLLKLVVQKIKEQDTLEILAF